MTIVEIIDYFNGFATIKQFMRTRNKVRLLWIFACLAFVLSAIIDNLTATIVLVTILQKVIHDRSLRLWFAGMIIVTANRGCMVSHWRCDYNDVVDWQKSNHP